MNGKARRSLASQQVRIIGGRWRRTPLAVESHVGLRPTPARVRETLFNWLGQDVIASRCADVFAGSGALGLEAASRGAASVHLFERDPRVLTTLQRTLAKLQASDRSNPQAAAVQLRLQRGDGIALLHVLEATSLDLIFCDPPFADAAALLPTLNAAIQHALRPGGVCYFELPAHREYQSWLEQNGYCIMKNQRVGQVQVFLVQLARAACDRRPRH